MEIIPDARLHSCLIKLAGEIDLCCVPELRSAFDAQMTEDRTAIILDLTNVSFMDSSGLSVIISYWRQMQEQGGQLVVVGAKGEVLEVFRLTHLDRYISLFKTDQEASAALDLVA